MKNQKIDVKNIIDVELDGIDFNDAPDFCDAHIISAVWSDSGKSLSDDELETLNYEYREFVYECVISHIY
jgi:hypothetical protein